MSFSKVGDSGSGGFDYDRKDRKYEADYKYTSKQKEKEREPTGAAAAPPAPGKSFESTVALKIDTPKWVDLSDSAKETAMKTSSFIWKQVLKQVVFWGTLGFGLGIGAIAARIFSPGTVTRWALGEKTLSIEGKPYYVQDLKHRAWLQEIATVPLPRNHDGDVNVRLVRPNAGDIGGQKLLLLKDMLKDRVQETALRQYQTELCKISFGETHPQFVKRVEELNAEIESRENLLQTLGPDDKESSAIKTALDEYKNALQVFFKEAGLSVSLEKANSDRPFFPNIVEREFQRQLDRYDRVQPNSHEYREVLGYMNKHVKQVDKVIANAKKEIKKLRHEKGVEHPALRLASRIHSQASGPLKSLNEFFGKVMEPAKGEKAEARVPPMKRRAETTKLSDLLLKTKGHKAPSAAQLEKLKGFPTVAMLAPSENRIMQDLLKGHGLENVDNFLRRFSPSKRAEIRDYLENQLQRTVGTSEARVTESREKLHAGFQAIEPMIYYQARQVLTDLHSIIENALQESETFKSSPKEKISSLVKEIISENERALTKLDEKTRLKLLIDLHEATSFQIPQRFKETNVEEDPTRKTLLRSYQETLPDIKEKLDSLRTTTYEEFERAHIAHGKLQTALKTLGATLDWEPGIELGVDETSLRLEAPAKEKERVPDPTDAYEKHLQNFLQRYRANAPKTRELIEEGIKLHREAVACSDFLRKDPARTVEFFRIEQDIGMLASETGVEGTTGFDELLEARGDKRLQEVRAFVDGTLSKKYREVVLDSTLIQLIRFGWAPTDLKEARILLEALDKHLKPLQTEAPTNKYRFQALDQLTAHYKALQIAENFSKGMQSEMPLWFNDSKNTYTWSSVKPEPAEQWQQCEQWEALSLIPKFVDGVNREAIETSSPMARNVLQSITPNLPVVPVSRNNVLGSISRDEADKLSPRDKLSYNFAPDVEDICDALTREPGKYDEEKEDIHKNLFSQTRNKMSRMKEIAAGEGKITPTIEEYVNMQTYLEQAVGTYVYLRQNCTEENREQVEAACKRLNSFIGDLTAAAKIYQQQSVWSNTKEGLLQTLKIDKAAVPISIEIDVLPDVFKPRPVAKEEAAGGLERKERGAGVDDSQRKMKSIEGEIEALKQSPLRLRWHKDRDPSQSRLAFGDKWLGDLATVKDVMNGFQKQINRKAESLKRGHDYRGESVPADVVNNAYKEILNDLAVEAARPGNRTEMLDRYQLLDAYIKENSLMGTDALKSYTDIRDTILKGLTTPPAARAPAGTEATLPRKEAAAAVRQDMDTKHTRSTVPLKEREAVETKASGQLLPAKPVDKEFSTLLDTARTRRDALVNMLRQLKRTGQTPKEDLQIQVNEAENQVTRLEGAFKAGVESLKQKQQRWLKESESAPTWLERTATSAGESRDSATLSVFRRGYDRDVTPHYTLINTAFLGLKTPNADELETLKATKQQVLGYYSATVARLQDAASLTPEGRTRLQAFQQTMERDLNTLDRAILIGEQELIPPLPPMEEFATFEKEAKASPEVGRGAVAQMEMESKFEAAEVPTKTRAELSPGLNAALKKAEAAASKATTREEELKSTIAVVRREAETSGRHMTNEDRYVIDYSVRVRIPLMRELRNAPLHLAVKGIAVGKKGEKVATRELVFTSKKPEKEPSTFALITFVLGSDGQKYQHSVTDVREKLSARVLRLLDTSTDETKIESELATLRKQVSELRNKTLAYYREVCRQLYKGDLTPSEETTLLNTQLIIEKDLIQMSKDLQRLETGSGTIASQALQRKLAAETRSKAPESTSKYDFVQKEEKYAHAASPPSPLSGPPSPVAASKYDKVFTGPGQDFLNGDNYETEMKEKFELEIGKDLEGMKKGFTELRKRLLTYGMVVGNLLKDPSYESQRDYLLEKQQNINFDLKYLDSAIQFANGKRALFAEAGTFIVKPSETGGEERIRLDTISAEKIIPFLKRYIETNGHMPGRLSDPERRELELGAFLYLKQLVSQHPESGTWWDRTALQADPNALIKWFGNRLTRRVAPPITSRADRESVKEDLKKDELPSTSARAPFFAIEEGSAQLKHVDENSDNAEQLLNTTRWIAEHNRKNGIDPKALRAILTKIDLFQKDPKNRSKITETLNEIKTVMKRGDFSHIDGAQNADELLSIMKYLVAPQGFDPNTTRHLLGKLDLITDNQQLQTFVGYLTAQVVGAEATEGEKLAFKESVISPQVLNQIQAGKDIATRDARLDADKKLVLDAFRNRFAGTTEPARRALRAEEAELPGEQRLLKEEAAKRAEESGAYLFQRTDDEAIRTQILSRRLTETQQQDLSDIDTAKTPKDLQDLVNKLVKDGKLPKRVGDYGRLNEIFSLDAYRHQEEENLDGRKHYVKAAYFEQMERNAKRTGAIKLEGEERLQKGGKETPPRTPTLSISSTETNIPTRVVEPPPISIAEAPPTPRAAEKERGEKVKESEQPPKAAAAAPTASASKIRPPSPPPSHEVHIESSVPEVDRKHKAEASDKVSTEEEIKWLASHKFLKYQSGEKRHGIAPQLIVLPMPDKNFSRVSNVLLIHLLAKEHQEQGLRFLRELTKFEEGQILSSEEQDDLQSKGNLLVAFYKEIHKRLQHTGLSADERDDLIKAKNSLVKDLRRFTTASDILAKQTAGSKKEKPTLRTFASSERTGAIDLGPTRQRIVKELNDTFARIKSFEDNLKTFSEAPSQLIRTEINMQALPLLDQIHKQILKYEAELMPATDEDLRGYLTTIISSLKNKYDRTAKAAVEGHFVNVKEIPRDIRPDPVMKLLADYNALLQNTNIKEMSGEHEEEIRNSIKESVDKVLKILHPDTDLFKALFNEKTLLLGYQFDQLLKAYQTRVASTTSEKEAKAKEPLVRVSAPRKVEAELKISAATISEKVKENLREVVQKYNDSVGEFIREKGNRKTLQSGLEEAAKAAIELLKDSAQKLPKGNQQKKLMNKLRAAITIELEYIQGTNDRDPNDLEKVHRIRSRDPILAGTDRLFKSIKSKEHAAPRKAAGARSKHHAAAVSEDDKKEGVFQAIKKYNETAGLLAFIDKKDTKLYLERLNDYYKDFAGAIEALEGRVKAKPKLQLLLTAIKNEEESLTNKGFEAFKAAYEARMKIGQGGIYESY